MVWAGCSQVRLHLGDPLGLHARYANFGLPFGGAGRSSQILGGRSIQRDRVRFFIGGRPASTLRETGA
jgi:hypothetical protein